MKKINKILVVFICFLVCFAFFTTLTICDASAFAKDNITSARGMCVMEKSTKRVLYSKSLHTKMPMASTTKIITALSVLSTGINLDQKTVIPREAIRIPGSSIYLEDGESLTVRDLLYGLILRSGNDAAVALAIITFGSVQEFLDYTNSFVKTLGAIDTHLANPHGLDDKQHYTTPYDLALISCCALENPIFAEISATKEKTIDKTTPEKQEKRFMKNKNKLLTEYEFADGVKTGYTGKAGRCFVGSATKDGMQVVCVVLNCNPMFEETKSLLQKAFNEFKMVKILDANSVQGTVSVTGNRKVKNVDVCLKNGFSYPLSEKEISNIAIQTKLDEFISVPFKSDCEVGEIQVLLGKHLIFCDKIYTIKGVEKNSVLDNLNMIIQDFNHKKEVVA